MTSEKAREVLIKNRMIGSFELADAIDFAIKALEQRTGRWIKHLNSFECSSCSFLSDFKWFYCPCCGEKKEMEDAVSD